MQWLRHLRRQPRCAHHTRTGPAVGASLPSAPRALRGQAAGAGVLAGGPGGHCRGRGPDADTAEQRVRARRAPLTGAALLGLCCWTELSSLFCVSRCCSAERGYSRTFCWAEGAHLTLPHPSCYQHCSRCPGVTLGSPSLRFAPGCQRAAGFCPLDIPAQLLQAHLPPCSRFTPAL